LRKVKGGSKLTPIADVPRDMLDDKDNGHTWRTQDKHTMRAASWGVRKSKQCQECGSWVHVLLNSRGEVDPHTRKYELTDRYKKVSGYSKADARAEIMRRERGQRMASAEARLRREAKNGRRLRAV
jgi:hypothetical protein